MELKNKLERFVSMHRISAWLLIIMASGLLLQILIFILGHSLGGDDGGEMYRKLISYFLIPSSFKEFIYQPWSLLTYPLISASPFFAFVPQEGGETFAFTPFAFSPFRLFFDGFLLWMFTRIFRQMLGEVRANRLAILSIPLIGLLTWILSTLISPGEGTHYLSGMTSLMIAYAVALATFIPKYPIQLFLFGRVPLVGIVVVLVLLDIATSMVITPVGISVIIGASWGFLLTYSLKNGTDITENIWSFYQSKEPKQRKEKTTAQKVKDKPSKSSNYQPPVTHNPNQDTIDKILDKINEKGYDSLSREEKEILFRASGKEDDEKA